ncbi:aldehyde dehydrogenase family protein [Sporosarcina soli]|uniref:Aldehyde dehydrogenase family protein n=1 Tax=Sporosarcina soli TaxID=334736 RepID=A0ABW0TIA1_9BACL
MNTQTVELNKNVAEFLKGTKKLFINGEFVESESGKTFNTYNPSTGEVLAVVSEASEKDVDKAVKAARKAFEDGPWPKMTAAERSHLMYRLSDLIEKHQEELAIIETLDNGKPINEARLIDLPNSIETYRYFSGWATKNMGQTIPISGNLLNYTKHEPVGVVGAIVPWNFPLMIAGWKVAPALATGCTVVLKPAEQTPLSVLYLGKLIKEAGFPDGVINIVPGFGETAGAAIVEHPDVNKVAFTGSTTVGQSIMREAAKTMKRVSLELGGKSPNIILPDADLSKAIPGVFTGIMTNQGEVCSAGSRIYVHKDLYEHVVSELTTLVEKVKMGIGMDEETQMGPLVSLEQQKRVQDYIEIGKKQGARVISGGVCPEKGYFVQPTIFADVTNDMRIAQEEIFGPTVVVISYDDIDDVIAKANDSDYGLAAGIWTENVKNAHYIAERLKAGTVWINTYLLVNPAAPFGGFKQSGFGRDMGSYALDNYTEVKSVWLSLE